MLGHGNTDNLRSPRLVKALSSRPVLSVSCGVHHTAAVVAIPGVSAFVGYENQPFRKESKLKRWGDLRVYPVNKYALSIRRLSRARSSVTGGQTTHRSLPVTGRSAAQTGAPVASTAPGTSRSRNTAATALTRTPGASPRALSQHGSTHADDDDHDVDATEGSSRPPRPASGNMSSRPLSGRRLGSSRLPPTDGVPAEVPMGTATYMKSQKRPGTHRSYQSDHSRKLIDLPLADQPSITSDGVPNSHGSPATKTTRTSASGKGAHSEKASTSGASQHGAGEVKSRFRQLSEMTRARLLSTQSRQRSGKQRLADTRKELHAKRGLPPLNNRVVPGTPAGELYTWGTGIFGEVGESLLQVDC